MHSTVDYRKQRSFRRETKVANTVLILIGITFIQHELLIDLLINWFIHWIKIYVRVNDISFISKTLSVTGEVREICTFVVYHKHNAGGSFSVPRLPRHVTLVFKDSSEGPRLSRVFHRCEFEPCLDHMWESTFCLPLAFNSSLCIGIMGWRSGALVFDVLPHF